MTFLLLGLYGGGAYYIIPEEGLRNNLLLHSGPIFSVNVRFHTHVSGLSYSGDLRGFSVSDGVI